MAEAHERSRRKSTGGRYRRNSKRKKRDLKGKFAATTLGETKTSERNSRGFTDKTMLKSGDYISVSKPSGETVKAEIEDVLENEANPDFVRRDILTKGTVVETSEGKVQITSRPGQDGTLNGKLLEE